jgi:Ca2+-binding EF-hand superfamily protein
MCVLIDHALVCHSTHPIKQFLALRHRDLDKLKSIFQQIDLDKDGKVSVEDYVMYLREPLSMASFVYQIFALSSNGNIKLDKYDNLNETPFMDVGSTLKATAVFCMLCSSELLKFVFVWYDDAGYGCISNEDFKKLLASFHSRHSDEHVARALKEFDLPEGGTMSYDTFERYVCNIINRTWSPDPDEKVTFLSFRLVKKLPHLLYPAFRVQEKMREQFLGVRFWEHKLELIAEAKALISQEEAESRELERQERQKRDEYANELNLEAIHSYVQKSKKKNRRR